MRDSKLVFVVGMSGVGKSTTSKNLAKQYQNNKIKHKWLHEEIANHPIRDGEFSIGSTYSEADMDLNVEEMYKRWEKLVYEVMLSEDVYIIEGCLYQSIIRYFFDCNYPINKITHYYDRVMEILKPVKPTIIHLYRPNVKASFEEAFKIRGQRWKNIILKPDMKGYFSKHSYEGDDSIFKMEEDYQDIARSMSDRFQGYKIQVDTSDHLWDQHMKKITSYLGIKFRQDSKETPVDNPKKYCGTYGVKIDGHQHEIEIKEVDGQLYCRVFWWENMKLIHLGNDQFEIQSFPITLDFEFHNHKRAVKVDGIYGWNIMGKTLQEI
ncbi:P-loop NTPase family protein [Haloplasma contractile]|uniref:AAA domain protein n=1 Tax=Haloplasma contractile SSD-17B TaxID=1033810 RepID=U2EEY7_9MOLU|nr:AAA family ATPase [Haloplasma contractile]ERJ13256.1 AAA domain protein [Haloplasma contractile SSD-17B]